VLADGTNTYTYGLNRIAQVSETQTGYFLGVALGSVRQVVDPQAEILLAQSYSPYGELLSNVGDYKTAYSFTGEMTDGTGLVNLRARYYDPGTGRFISRDTWGGDYNNPVTLGKWVYANGNPIIYIDPSGLYSTEYGIVIDDQFTTRDRDLILETFSDFANLLGGINTLSRNLALSFIKQDWTNPSGTYNATYNDNENTITLQPGWYTGVITTLPNGQAIIILGPPCLDKLFGFPEGSLPTDEIGAKFVLAHEMSHALQIGNPNSFSSFKENVELPWSIFAGTSSNPLIKRNRWRSSFAQEVFADVIAAYLYSPGLLNQQMSDWVLTKLHDTLK
jgi:RHS repeat-associated protein